MRKRTLALGFTQLGLRAGTASLPLACQFIIDGYGWRTGYVFLGILALIIGALPAAVMIRQRPEDVGLEVDGEPRPLEPAAAGGESRPAPRVEESWTLGEARKTAAMWLLTISLSLGSIVIGGFNLHMVPFLLDKGIDSMLAVGAATVFAVTSGMGGLFWGWIASRISARHAVSVLSFTGGVFIVALLYVDSPVAIYVMIGLYGLAFGGWGPLSNSLWADYYGRRNLGSIIGFIAPVRLAANASGPLVGGFLYDYFGDYTIAFMAYGAAYILSAMVMFVARQPRRQAAATTPVE
jgi:MFS family permease